MRATSIFIIAGVSCLLIFAVGIFLWKREENRRWRWEKIPMPERLARVPEEWDASTLARAMQRSKKIRHAATFEEAAEQVKLQRVRPGGYALPPEAGPLDLAQIFARGPSHLEITFPEGWTAHQMSNRLRKNGFVAAPELRALAYPPRVAVSKLEGRLFPDTYWLALKANARGLAGRFQERYHEVTNKLPRPFPAVAGGKRLSLHEVTVLASLVERETHLDSERSLVAGVLLKRLREGMRLQCDASVQYAIQRAAIARGDESHQTVLRRHYKFDSPYNTYLHKGLPPGAICNPGARSLRAAARPRATEYLFYVWSPKLKRHRFAKTFEGHKHNIALARKESVAY